jgi:regulatory GntR family protein
MSAPGARLPSWQDLAAQLGVARGTVRSAYEKLAAAQLIVASRAAGTHVAERPRAVIRSEQPPDPGSFMEMYQEMSQGPAIFQMGVPATETFPATLLARIRSHAVRAEARAAPVYPDPRGEFELRRDAGLTPAVSSLGGLRTPAAGARDKACERPASENLHRSRHSVAYSITSSARARRDGGTSRPSALAVLRLIASSNFVG